LRAADSADRDAAKSWLGCAFHHVGWLGGSLPGGKRMVRCPWVATHTDGRGAGLDSSTVLLPPAPGQTFGGFRCAHAHCEGRTWRDVLDVLPGHVRWAAEQATRRDRTRLELEKLSSSRRKGGS
jgi:hypothetical protein